MAIRYSPEYLIHLRESPLCAKPSGLAPAEEWMGPPPDNSRAQNKVVSDKRHHDNPLLDQTNRRPGPERHMSRNSANPEDIILGPPRTSFASSGALRNSGSRPFDNDADLKDFDSRDRFNLRNRNGDAEGNDRLREPRTSNFGRRGRGEGGGGGGDQDSEGWSTVKPRKSFGHEGAERFQGRMGGERPSDRKPRDKDDHDASRDRPRRVFEKDGEDSDARPRNGLNRNKSEPWFKNDGTKNESEKVPMSNRERIDRAKSWRDRDRESETFTDRNQGRGYDRRWDREQRNDRQPEWMDEPAGHKDGGHTEEDFKKFMESMKAAKAGPPAEEKKPAPLSEIEAAIKADGPVVASAPAVESGPDKFFAAFGGGAGLSAKDPAVMESAPKPARPNTGKASRFTSFFSAPQEDNSRRTQTEPPAPMSGPPATGFPAPEYQPQDSEKQAFQVLLQKLHRSGISGSTPPASFNPFQEPAQPPPQPTASAGSVKSPAAFQQFAPPDQQQRQDARGQSSQRQSAQEVHAPRPSIHSHPSASRQDQLLQDLVGQRQQASSQGSGRANSNRNTEFLMNLMKSQPEPVRTEQMLMRMHQQRNPSVSHMQERELEFSPGGRGSQPQTRGQPPPGFMDEPSFPRPDPEGRPQQPTQILQRPPPPPGLDQMNPNWMQQHGGGPVPPPQQQQQQPQQQRNMGAPPGLLPGGGPGGLGGPGGPGGPSRQPPMPAGMFSPVSNFPPGVAFPPPEAMAVPPPPRGMQPPPGFFGGPPPPGFMGPPGMGGGPGGPGFQGPADGPGGFPFDGRSMPPPGASQAFRRQ